MENEKKEIQYLGNAKTIKRKDGSEFLVGTICIDDMNQVEEEHRFTSETNGKTYIKIAISEYMAGKNEWGNTHSISLDTWKPDPDYHKKQKDII